MSRAAVLICTLLLCSSFTWPPDYAEQSRWDVSTCVGYARLTSPTFEARVRNVNLESGHVDIERSPNDSRGERAFNRCLLAVRQWRLIERHLPRPTDPPPPDPTTMADRHAGSLVR